jgi:hypothetical protein
MIRSFIRIRFEQNNRIWIADRRHLSLDLGKHMGSLVQKRLLAHPQSIKNSGGDI